MEPWLYRGTHRIEDIGTGLYLDTRSVSRLIIDLIEDGSVYRYQAALLIDVVYNWSIYRC